MERGLATCGQESPARSGDWARPPHRPAPLEHVRRTAQSGHDRRIGIGFAPLRKGENALKSDARFMFPPADRAAAIGATA